MQGREKHLLMKTESTVHELFVRKKDPKDDFHFQQIRAKPFYAQECASYADGT